MPWVFNPFSGTFDFYQTGSSGGGTVIEGAYVTVDTTPFETPDGSITTFTTPDTFFPNSLSVFINGLYEAHVTEGIGNNSFTLDYAPETGDLINITYSMQV